MKVIIWGYKENSHTHHFIHEAFFNTFKFLGYDVYWFDDKNYPSDFNWNNCLFWTEGFADKNIPLNSNSVYFVHVCPDPCKYLNANVKKFIDVRYNNKWHHDHVYSYTMNKEKMQKIGACVYLEESSKQQIFLKNDYISKAMSDYDKLYISWATHLLPNQINFDDIYFPRQNKIYFCGNLTPNGRCENLSSFMPFIYECEKNNIEFIHNDPFQKPLSSFEVEMRTKNSLLGVDIRGPEHLKNGYVPCRVFKSISFGHLGITNSQNVYEELEGNCIHNSDTAELFYDSFWMRFDYNFIKTSMLYVKENHTYINRINSILKIL